MNMGGFDRPNLNEKEEGKGQDVVIPEFVDENVDTNNVTSNLIIRPFLLVFHYLNLNPK